jgi:hypothetical protein
MWYGPFYAVGRVAGRLVRARTNHPRPGSDPVIPDRRGNGLTSRLLQALGRTDSRLSRAAKAAAVEAGRALMDQASVRSSLDGVVTRMGWGTIVS